MSDYFLRKLGGGNGELYFMSLCSDKGIRDKQGTRYAMICPSCHGELKGNPIKHRKIYSGERKGQYKHTVFSMPINKNGMDYKVLCCGDKVKCRKQWEKMVREEKEKYAKH